MIPYLMNCPHEDSGWCLDCTKWPDSVGRYLRMVPRGTDGVAVHLGTGAVLLTSEFAASAADRVAGRPVRVKPPWVEVAS